VAATSADTTVPAGDLARVVVSTHRGVVEVRAWDRDEVSIVTDGDAADITLDRTGRVLVIEQHNEWMADDVDVRLTIPADLAIDIEGMFTSIDIAGVRGAVSAETVHGSIEVTGGSGTVELTSVQGGIRTTGTRGDLQLESTNGSVEVRDHDGPLSAEAVNGGILLERVTASRVEAESVNGTIEYDGTIAADGQYAFRSHSGGIILRVPAEISASISVETFAGSFESDFPIMLREAQSGGSLQFVLGSGAARVELESFAGGIELRRAGGR
jgi:DUF4097 and DUF4098 domain-containing protein YvlB